MNEKLVAELVSQGEGPNVEFKEKYSSRLLETLVAFVNTAGGHILVGVDNRGRIKGLFDPKATAESILSACREAISPAVQPTVDIVSLEGKALVLVSVERTGRMYVKGGTVFIRHGRQTRRATAEEIRYLTLEESPEVFERQPVREASLRDLDEEALRVYFEERAPGVEGKNHIKLTELTVGQSLAVRYNGEVVPTVAGLMHFGRNPQQFNTNWGITALRVRGQDLADPIIDRKELAGTASELIEKGRLFVAGHMHIGYEFEENGVTRRDIPEYPMDAVREVLANAVAHRDYSVNERVQLRLFDDCLEVQNPGSLLPGLTLEMVLRGGVPRRRNTVISQILREKGYVEEVGRGLVFIHRRMREIGAGDPQFEATPSHFIVNLPSRHRTL
ncbi:hypothetical protein HKBW3S43_00577 [Candidatus Hakubella thermalkaliphila]|uniref:Schlafen AlbA-2 domain-containing protein n=1 Tax=Candidatus Hakubella thermalkaliphila TaxID=2754717 RepID=A0A6V8PQ64_9ACTN|nr:RNA-binding domain-containing protein [Candidatus Hakubella thermalkaliphila]GFP34785.1 hypothetical protein HKBW3S43_00577 [Candidatus Hakubella thermalkaliphila]